VSLGFGILLASTLSVRPSPDSTTNISITDIDRPSCVKLFQAQNVTFLALAKNMPLLKLQEFLRWEQNEAIQCNVFQFEIVTAYAFEKYSTLLGWRAIQENSGVTKLR
jgi:hypothetical protein